MASCAIGLRRARSERERALALLDDLITLIPSKPLSAAAGAVRLNLERGGMMIGNIHLWVAAQARIAGLTLVTNNPREFRRVPGLALENYAEQPFEASGIQSSESHRGYLLAMLLKQPARRGDPRKYWISDWV